MQQLLSSLEEERQRQFRRFVAISAGVHVGLALLFWIGPIRTSSRALPVVERVALVPMAPAPAPPAAKPAQAKPKPQPEPLPAPPPPPPPVAKKVLPKQPAPLPKPKPKAEAKPKAEPKAKPEPKKPEPTPEQDLDDVIKQLRDEAGETAPRPVQQQQAVAVGPAGGPGIVDPELARWVKEVKVHVTRAWIVTPEYRNQKLETLLEVEVDASGEVRDVRVTESSGNPWYDENVERALRKASPLPPPPRPCDCEFSFRPDELQ